MSRRSPFGSCAAHTPAWHPPPRTARVRSLASPRRSTLAASAAPPRGLDCVCLIAVASPRAPYSLTARRLAPRACAQPRLTAHTLAASLTDALCSLASAQPCHPS
eukprot:scaffold37672_cov76-Phaeocystis_antarctica.AAC.1